MTRPNIFCAPKFLLPSSPNKRNSNELDSDFLPSPSTPSPDPTLSWDEKYTPTTESDLAVRVQKVDEVKYYIKSSAISKPLGQYKMLVLTGPTGVGKSTTIRVLAKSMGYDIIEWKNQQQQNPQSGYFDPDYEPTIERFSRFLHRSINTTGLSTGQQRPRIILLDDIPDLTTAYIKQQFQSLLRSYIESNSAFLIVLVHSVAQMVTGFGRNRYGSWETQLTNLDDLVTNDIRLTGRCGTVEFNPIIKARMKNALSEILKREKRISKSPAINQQQLEQIIESCHGDIRNAVLTMQFYSINPYTRTKKRKLGYDSVDMSGVSVRESFLEFYHAIGKVLFAKRTPSGDLESKPIDILQKTSLNTDSYLGFLYANHHQMMNNIHDISASMNCLCDADMLSGMGAWNDEMPLEYQLLISMLGIMAVERSPEVLARKCSMKGPGEIYFKSAVKDSPRFITPIITGAPVTPSRNDNDKDTMEPIENENGELWDDGARKDDDDDEFDDVYGDVDDLAFFDSIP